MNNLKDYQAKKTKEAYRKAAEIDLEAAKEKALKRVLNNSYCRAFIEKNAVSDAEVRRYLAEFLAVCDANETATPCTISSCPKGLNGYHLGLRRHGLAIESYYYICAYRANFDKIASYYLYRDFPDEWTIMTFNDWRLSPSRARLIKEFRRLLVGENDCLYIYGEPGLGKSFSACMLLNKLIEMHRDDETYRVAFASAKNVVDDLRTTLYDKTLSQLEKKEEKKKTLDKLTTANALVLDGIGSETNTDWSRDEIIYETIAERKRKGLITIFTSDFSLRDLITLYGDKSNVKTKRLANLLTDYATVVALKKDANER